MLVYVAVEEDGQYSDYSMSVLGVYASVDGAKASLKEKIDSRFAKLREAQQENTLLYVWLYGSGEKDAVSRILAGEEVGYRWEQTEPTDDGVAQDWYHYDPYSGSDHIWTICEYEVQ